MALLKKAENLQGFLKAGFLGFGGTGKTYTAGLLAIGLAKRDPQKRPVAFTDTENGADYLIPKFEEAGVEFLVAKTRAFVDLLATAEEVEGQCSVWIVDSVTHIWRELCESYCKRHKIRKLQFQHWNDLKREWQAWTDIYLNGQLHTIVCGRAGWIYDFFEDEDGKRELIKTGTKMKVETEFGFEPSLLLEMERVQKDGGIGAGWTHRCHVLKDRTDTIDGAVIDDPTLDAFEPVLAALNITGKHLAIDTSRTSDAMFDDSEKSRSENFRLRKISLEEIEETCKLLWPSTTGLHKQMKIAALELLFDTKSWTAIKSRPLMDLQLRVRVLRQFEEQADNDLLADKEATLSALTGILKRENQPIGDDEFAALGVPTEGGVHPEGLSRGEAEAAGPAPTIDTSSQTTEEPKQTGGAPHGAPVTEATKKKRGRPSKYDKFAKELGLEGEIATDAAVFFKKWDFTNKSALFPHVKGQGTAFDASFENRETADAIRNALQPYALSGEKGAEPLDSARDKPEQSDEDYCKEVRVAIDTLSMKDVNAFDKLCVEQGIEDESQLRGLDRVQLTAFHDKLKELVGEE